MIRTNSERFQPRSARDRVLLESQGVAGSDDLSAYAVAKACRVPRTRIERIAREDIGITADTALRLAELFGNSAEFWLGLQADHDVETARARLAGELERIEPRPQPA